MSNKNLTILAVLAAGMLALAISLSTASKNQSGDIAVPQYLIGNIEPKLIDSIVLSDGEETVTLERDGKFFLIENKDGYPADNREINTLINSCIDIKTAEIVTDNADNHADLGVSKDAAGNVVKFLKKDGSLLTGVVVGSSKKGGQGTYIRRPGEDTVYLTLDRPWLKTGAMDYIDQELTESFVKSDVESVIVKLPDENYTLTADEDGNIAIDKLPEGRTLKNSEVNAVFTAISNLRFNDVAKTKDGLNFNKTYICKKADETVYTFYLAEKDGKYYAKCFAEYTGGDVVNLRRRESEEELKAKEAKLLAQERKMRFENKTKGWIFELPSTSAEKITKPVEDLLEELPEPEPEKAAEKPETVTE